jgi:hypothetical protein
MRMLGVDDVENMGAVAVADEWDVEDWPRAFALGKLPPPLCGKHLTTWLTLHHEGVLPMTVNVVELTLSSR